MAKKEFFRKLTPREMREQFAVERSYTTRGLVERIWELDGTSEAIELRASLLPPALLAQFSTGAAASRKEFKHGELIPVRQPKTRQDACEFPYIPLVYRMQAFASVFQGKKEEEIDVLGISWYPVQGRDRRKRVVPFEVVLEGTKLYCYAVHRAGGITLQGKYTQANRVKTEGGTILCEVPSRTEHAERYKVNLVHVPLVRVKENNAIILSLRTQYEEGGEPERVTFLHHLRYTREKEPESSDIFVFGPHDIAAYLAVTRRYWRGIENTVPLEMNPFPLPAKKWARYYDKLDNNTMIYDPTLTSKEKLRNLHIVEKCLLLARSISVKGAYETAFWDPARDGKLSDYWQ